MKQLVDHGRLRVGSVLWILDDQGEPYPVKVREVEEGAITIDALGATLGMEGTLLVEHRVPGDARYRVRVCVERDAAGDYVLLPMESWARDNQRAYVRVSTYGINARVQHALETWVDEDDLMRCPEERYTMLDVSAGGTALEADERFAIGDEVICHFELPGEACFVIPGRVVRLVPPRPGRRRGITAVEFTDLDETNRSALLRWVFREETRRRRC